MLFKLGYYLRIQILKERPAFGKNPKFGIWMLEAILVLLPLCTVSGWLASSTPRKGHVLLCVVTLSCNAITSFGVTRHSRAIQVVLTGRLFEIQWCVNGKHPFVMSKSVSSLVLGAEGFPFWLFAALCRSLSFPLLGFPCQWHLVW